MTVVIFILKAKLEPYVENYSYPKKTAVWREKNAATNVHGVASRPWYFAEVPEKSQSLMNRDPN